MWRWLLIANLAWSSLAWAAGETTPASSIGPTSSAEAKILWQDSTAAFQAENYQKVANLLSRYVDRYPGEAHYIQAHWWLGKAWYKLKSPEKAVAPLKYFIDEARLTDESAQARLILARVELALRKNQEAYLLARETQEKLNGALKVAESPPPAEAPTGSSERRMGKSLIKAHLSEALLLESESLMALGFDQRARLALDSAAKNLPQDLGKTPLLSALQGETKVTELKLKLRDCARYPTQEKMDEAQAQAQFQRRGSCLLEGTLLLKATLEAGDPEAADMASFQASQGFKLFHRACDHPPAPLGKRTAVEKIKYEDELKTLLKSDCDKTSMEALTLAEGWRQGPQTRADFKKSKALALFVDSLKTGVSN